MGCDTDPVCSSWVNLKPRVSSAFLLGSLCFSAMWYAAKTFERSLQLWLYWFVPGHKGKSRIKLEKQKWRLQSTKQRWVLWKANEFWDWNEAGLNCEGLWKWEEGVCIWSSGRELWQGSVANSVWCAQINELETVPGALAREEITIRKMHGPWLGALAEQAERNCNALEMLHETDQWHLKHSSINNISKISSKN